MREFRKITVYCGSSLGKSEKIRECTLQLAAHLVQQNIELVYGGAKVGLMGLLADEVLHLGGKVIGIIPARLNHKEVIHSELTELYVVDSMHARKMMMSNLGDAYVALPGGWGTFEEIIEMITWTQLNLHLKPSGLLNCEGFFDPFLAMAQRAHEFGFIKRAHLDMVQVDEDPKALIQKLSRAEIPDVRKLYGI